MLFEIATADDPFLDPRGDVREDRFQPAEQTKELNVAGRVLC